MTDHSYTTRVQWTGNRGEGTAHYKAYDRTYRSKWNRNVFEHEDFLLLNLVSPAAFTLHPNLAGLPLGISYFTFSGIAYITDIWRNVAPAESNFIRFANYLLMFPKLMMGPITRYPQVTETLPTATMKRLTGGVHVQESASGENRDL